MKLNYEDNIIDEILKHAEKELTLFGKVCIIKSMAISKIAFVVMCLTVPDGIKQIDHRIFRYSPGSVIAS